MKYYMTPGKHGLGWLPDVPDQRDYVYQPAARLTAAPARPSHVDLRAACPPVYDQGQLGSCTANALAAAFDFDRHKEGKAYLTPSRLFIYYNERAVEGTIESDAGARIRDGVKVLVSQGASPENDWPYDIAKFTDKPPAKAYGEGLKNQALSYQRILRPSSDTTSNMLACLVSGYPFVSGISVYDSFETEATAQAGLIPMPAKTESLLGGHAILVVGYDLARQLFICRNSWGTSWGDKGYMYLPFAYLANSSLASDQWVIRTVEV